MAADSVFSHTVRVPPDLSAVIREELANGLNAWAEDTLLEQKDSAAVAFAHGITKMGWLRSYQPMTAKPQGATQGGFMRRSIRLIRADAKTLTVRFQCFAKYAPYIHNGTARIIGRPFITRPMIERIKVLRDELAQKVERDYI